MNVENPPGQFNYFVLGVYLAVMVVIGLYFARRQKTTDDYFLAGRNMPWIAVAMSVFASITSAVSFMGVPGIVFRENISILVGILMMPVVAPVIILLFLPFYRRLNVTTSYEYVRVRFGSRARYAVSALFILARLGWLGTVIYAPALALSAVSGIEVWLAIMIMGGLGTLYTVLGGIEAVIWTDVVQFAVMMGGAIWVAGVLIADVPGGVSGIFARATESGHMNLYEWRPSLTEMTVTVVVVSYFFNFLHDYGVDQLTAQRLLTVRNFRAMAWATMVNALITVLGLGLLAFVGLGMFAYYAARPDALPDDLAGDRIFPYFIMTALPAGAASLMLSGFFAAAMSSVDSGINSVATVAVSDFVRPLRKNPLTDRAELQLARWLTLALGVLTTALAFYAASLGSLVQASQAFIGLFSGPVLALFLLGMLTRRGSFHGWCAGVVVAVPLTYVVQSYTDIHFIYYFPLCFLTCYIIGLAASWLFPQTAPPGTTVWDKHTSTDSAG